MPNSKDTDSRPSDTPSFVVREDTIEYGFIGKLQSLKYEYREDIRDRAALEKNFREKFDASTLLKDNPDIEKCLFVVDGMVALPGQLFYSSEIPVCLWFLAKKNADAKRGFRDRRRHNLVFESCIRCNSHPNPWHN